MKLAIDIDGVITANPEVWKWLTFHLKKKMNDNEIHIVTARNPSREGETIRELKYWGINYDHLHFMGEDLPRDFETQGLWKIKTINKIKPDIWFDDHFKIYERVCGIEINTPNTERVLI